MTTAKTNIHRLSEFGQSIWLDYISRSLIKSGKLAKMIEVGVRGMTSNPTIFDEAISQGNDYDSDILKLAGAGKSVIAIYDELTIRDVQAAADLFRQTYDATGGLDGYVSLEINPQLSEKKEESIQEGMRLFGRVARPNVMIKVPVTSVGPEVVEELIAQGVNVNATLIFSPDQYWKTAWAYFRGLEKYSKINPDLSRIRSVASVFVSRVDTAVDYLIAEYLKQENAKGNALSIQGLRGRAAVANCEIIFHKFKQMFSTKQFRILSEKGAAVQRLLWASTGTKNPAYSDIKYLAELVSRPTVNTVPEKTLNAFLDHGDTAESLKGNMKQAKELFAQFAEIGINMDTVYSKLLQEGIKAFIKSFESLLGSLKAKSDLLYAKS